MNELSCHLEYHQYSASDELSIQTIAVHVNTVRDALWGFQVGWVILEEELFILPPLLHPNEITHRPGRFMPPRPPSESGIQFTSSSSSSGATQPDLKPPRESVNCVGDAAEFTYEMLKQIVVTSPDSFFFFFLLPKLHNP